MTETGAGTGDTQDRTATARAWARIFVVAGVAVLAIFAARSLLQRHVSEVTQRELAKQERREKARHAEQQRALVDLLVRDYLALQTKQWPRRDRILELIERLTTDARIKAWATDQRKKIAPMLQWLESRQQQLLDPAAARPGGAAPGPAPGPATGATDATGADAAKGEGEGELGEMKTPEWKGYAAIRDRLRRARGKLCCKITTGRILFSRANSMEACRLNARGLCNALAKAAGEQQKCLYVLSQECTSGEIIGGGDVTGEP